MSSPSIRPFSLVLSFAAGMLWLAGSGCRNMQTARHTQPQPPVPASAKTPGATTSRTTPVAVYPRPDGITGPAGNSVAKTPAAKSTETKSNVVQPAGHLQPQPGKKQPDKKPVPKVPPLPQGKVGDKTEPKKIDPKTAGKKMPAGKKPVEDANVNRIALPTALALVAGQNPRVGFVQQRVQEAFARQEFAESLWVPTLRAGVNYYKHEGQMQNAQGQIIDADRTGVFTGLGARAIGSGPPSFPGLSVAFDSGDAVFQPIIARRTAAARQHGLTAAVNDLLLQAAFAYVDLQVAVDQRRIATEILSELQTMATLTASFAKRGQGTLADADRAQTELNLQRNILIRTTEQIRLASARLAEILSVGDGMNLRPADREILPVELVAPDANLEALVTQAFSNRPELHENAFDISAACSRYEMERYSPLMPVVGGGLSYGGFGGGLANRVGNFDDRWDADAWMFWEIRNLGFGEAAARHLASSQVHQLQFRRGILSNRIRREVIAAYVRLESARSQIAQAEASVKSARSSYQRNVARIRNAQGLPLEVLQSINALNNAKRDQLNAKANFNRAQFELHRALGWPIQ